ncbi:MAG: glycine--tRNA ligase [Patescibacteria group bacterium]|nr:glycine--tRNA ligase [Patescibacteria group bacterium]
MTNKNNVSMEKIVSLCKRRGFIFPDSEIYGGLANAWDYGPYGVELKNNIKQRWWKKFVQEREDMVGQDAAIIMNPETWKASGHLDNFSDPLVECKKCKNRFRADQLEEAGKCPNCGGQMSAPRQFNLMFKTFIGPAEESVNIAYLRPETAQGIFVNFKNIMDTMRPRLPFGIGQIGKAFRNEITPGNFIFRTREFEQMEIEYFIAPPKKDKDWQTAFEMWRKEMLNWMAELGLNVKHDVYELNVPDGERAHYSKKTIDFEYQFPFGRKELYGLAYRTDYDLKQHAKFSGADLFCTDEQGDKFVPHVIEPSLGVERTVLAVLYAAYCEETTPAPNPSPAHSSREKGEENIRTVMKFPYWLAPVKIAVFPLLKNKPELVKKAKAVFNQLKSEYNCEFDDNGNIGKRYRRQDEIGTPFCLTVDFDTLEKGDVTVRNRDTMKQERVKIEKLGEWFGKKLK